MIWSFSHTPTNARVHGKLTELINKLISSLALRNLTKAIGHQDELENSRRID